MPVDPQLIKVFGDDLGGILKAAEEGLNPQVQQLMAESLGTLQFDARIFADQIEKRVSMLAGAGMDEATIRKILHDDMRTGGRIFGELRNNIKGGMAQSINQSGRAGQMEAYKPTEILAWVTVGGHKVCPDCDARAGQTGTIEFWEANGLPGSGWSVCQGFCYCILDPTGKIDKKVKAPPKKIKPEKGATIRKPKVRVSPSERLRRMVKNEGVSDQDKRFHMIQQQREKYGAIGFEGMSEGTMEIIADALEDTLGRYGITINHIGYFQGRRFKAKGAAGAAWGKRGNMSGRPGTRAIGLQKTYTKSYKAEHRRGKRVWESNREINILKTKEKIEFYKDLQAKGTGYRAGYYLEQFEDRLKILEDPKFTRWTIEGDNGLYATVKHESWHQIDYQLRPDGKLLRNFFNKHLDDLGVTKDEWYQVSEYAGSELGELWSETGTALDLGLYVPPNIKKAFIAAIKDAGFTYP